MHLLHGPKSPVSCTPCFVFLGHLLVLTSSCEVCKNGSPEPRVLEWSSKIILSMFNWVLDPRFKTAYPWRFEGTVSPSPGSGLQMRIQTDSPVILSELSPYTESFDVSSFLKFWTSSGCEVFKCTQFLLGAHFKPSTPTTVSGTLSSDRLLRCPSFCWHHPLSLEPQSNNWETSLPLSISLTLSLGLRDSFLPTLLARSLTIAIPLCIPSAGFYFQWQKVLLITGLTFPTPYLLHFLRHSQILCMHLSFQASPKSFRVVLIIWFPGWPLFPKSAIVWLVILEDSWVWFLFLIFLSCLFIHEYR